jgi:hypothetical protein
LKKSRQHHLKGLFQDHQIKRNLTKDFYAIQSLVTFLSLGDFFSCSKNIGKLQQLYSNLKRLFHTCVEAKEIDVYSR